MPEVTAPLTESNPTHGDGDQRNPTVARKAAPERRLWLSECKTACPPSGCLSGPKQSCPFGKANALFPTRNLFRPRALGAPYRRGCGVAIFRHEAAIRLFQGWQWAARIIEPLPAAQLEHCDSERQRPVTHRHCPITGSRRNDAAPSSFSVNGRKDCRGAIVAVQMAIRLPGIGMCCVIQHPQFRVFHVSIN